MKKVDISALEPGDVTAAAVTDAGGRELLKAGTVLTKVWIDRLKARGVESVGIEESEPEVEEEAVSDNEDTDVFMIDTESRDRIDGWVKSMFGGMEDSELVSRIRNGTLLYLSARGWRMDD